MKEKLGDSRELRQVFLDSSGLIRALWGKGMRHAFSRHLHTSLCVGLVKEGKRSLFVRGRWYELGPGSLFLLPPGEPHECCCTGKGGHAYQILLWSPSFLRTLGSPGDDIFSGNPAFFEDPLLRKDFLDLFRISLEGKKPLLSKKGAPFLRKCLSHASFLSGKKELPDQRMSLLERYLAMHCCRRVPLEELAELCSLSPWHVQRLFLRRFGVTPGEYASMLRIRKSLEFLAQGRSCADTALDLGFADQSHFSRTFRKIMGVPPGKICLEEPPSLSSFISD
ncbi:MAG TPA: AraC family transcriptional regulator [Synergistaceae bacterium]|nr:AraC family transcriptional regulator [Synergistaceae bacterium]HPJ26309.1 AraC family transcriptional regulator [Synergistaceae bacterium]HPQ37404.1 AraC family transcriptional regulator [Synergistaceae bacterium]